VTDVHHTLERAGITVFERGWLSSNNVLIRGGDDGAVLVDSGYWNHADQTVSLVRHALDGECLYRVVNTHLHSDHCGGNAALQAAFSCRIDVPVGTVDAVDAWDEERLTYRPTGQHCPPFRRTGTVSAPSVLRLGQWEWQAIAAPGHDPTSIALYQPDLKLLISADALWENGFGVIFPELEGESAFDEVGATLDQFQSLDVRLVIPGHGAPFTDMNAAIGRARSRLRDFVEHPAKHAVHGARVLLKFHMLEVREQSRVALMAWLAATRFFDLVRDRWFPKVSGPAWAERIINDLIERGAIREKDGLIVDSGD
jgi:glyoxylase-like metal-dependent hydrolase (beta-lactamase superfamily II)